MQVPPRYALTPLALQNNTASMVLFMPPKSGVLIWIMWPALARAKSITSSNVFHHSSATNSTGILWSST